jgi:uncharacterized delta-60 repeat protein
MLPPGEAFAAFQRPENHAGLHSAKENQGTRSRRQCEVGERKRRRIKKKHRGGKPASRFPQRFGSQAQDESERDGSRNDPDQGKGGGINGCLLERQAAKKRVTGKGRHRHQRQADDSRRGHDRVPAVEPDDLGAKVTTLLPFLPPPRQTISRNPNDTNSVSITSNEPTEETIMFTQFGIEQVRAWIARRNGILTNRSRAKAPLVLALVLALLGGTGLAQAADGDLDPTFGNGGKVLTDFNSSNDWLSRIAVQPDGKIVAIGDTHPSHRGALARYNPDGTLDQTFGNGGKVITVASVRESAAGLLILPDGKIMIGGSFGEFDTSFLLLRFNSNGSVDSTFGNGGMVTTNLGTDNDRVYALALQSDGKIVAAGKKGIQFNPTEQRKGNAALARYNPDGSLDPTFGSGGIVINDFGQGLESYAIEVIIQPDGRIIIAGESSYAFLVARYNSNGTLDSTFGNGDGFALVSSSNNWDHGRDAVLQADGKIILVGSAQLNSPYESFAVARFNSDGSLDKSFGDGGTVLMVDQGDLEAAVLQSDGKLIALGTSGVDFTLLRLNTDGSLDSTFGSGGTVVTTFGGSAADGSDIILQTDGKIVAGGLSSTDFFFQNTDFALARYLDGANPTPTPTPAPTPKKGRRTVN